MDTVLIVDDSSFIVDGLIAFLKKKYRPLAAYGGAECLEILKRETPSVIILDIMMEPMDGWETLSHIKENPATRQIPVLMFSAIKISPEEAVSHRVSIDDCLTKPVSPNKIVEAIEKVLARRDTHRVVIGRWQAAGVPPEKIDEYLSLVTSLEVDLSLCQNMRIQYDLLDPKDTNESEFQAMIQAIEDRVVQQRNQIETLGREMNETLEKGFAATTHPSGAEVTREPAEPEPHPVPEESRTGAPPAVSGGSAAEPSPEMSREAEEKESPGRDPSRGAETTTPGYPQEITSLPSPGPREPGTGETIPPADSPGTQVTFNDAVSGIPAPETASPSIPSEEQGSGTPAEIHPLRENGTGTMQEPVQGTYPISGIAAIQPAAADQRNVIPADPDLPLVRADSGTSLPPPGAGTDIPMPWGLPADRKSHEITGGSEKNPPATGASEKGSTPGFLARILSFVRSIFHKP